MAGESRERRKEVRFVIAAGAVIKILKSGETIRTTTTNISGCGALLHFDDPITLDVGDEVSCECTLPSEGYKSLPLWTTGRITRVGEGFAAIEFVGGVFSEEFARRRSSAKDPVE